MRLLLGLSGPSLARAFEAIFRDQTNRGQMVHWVVPGRAAAHFHQQRLAATGIAFAPQRILSSRAFFSQFLGAPPPPRPWIDARLRERLSISPELRLRNYARLPVFRDRVSRLIEEFAAAAPRPATILAGFLARRTRLDSVSRALLEVVASILADAAAGGFRWPGQLGEWKSGGRHSLDRATYLIDGFRDFTPPERDFLSALARWDDVWVTLPQEGSGPAACLRQWLAEGSMIDSRPPEEAGPAMEAVEASTPEGEANEVARRLITAHRAGRRWADCAILLRQNSSFAALLRSTLDRFGIPFHDEFSRPLQSQPPISFLLALIASRQTGWSHDALLSLVNHGAAPFSRDTAARLAIRLAESRPAHGIDTLPELASFLRPVESWPLQASPASWADLLSELPRLAYRGQQPDPADSASLPRWRQRASALRQWPELVRECARQLSPIDLPLAHFLEELHHHLRLTPSAILPPAGDAVTLTSVTESGARHWPVVFLPEMLAGVFPQRITPDPLLDDRLRAELTEAGLPLRLSWERQEAESALLPWAVERAGEVLTLSYAQFGPAGEALDPSPALAGWGFTRALPCRPLWPARPALRNPLLPLPSVSPPPEDYKYRPSEIDSYRGCPFRHFAQYRLRLRLPPASPSERFDAREQGSLIHRVLHRWVREQGDGTRLLAEEFQNLCRRKNIPLTHQVEFARLEVVRHLTAYLETAKRPRDLEVFTEWPFAFSLTPAIVLSGRIDRFDLGPDGEATAIDYKYSKRDRVRALEDSVQGGLYLLALEAAGYQPRSFAYVPLRDQADPVVFDDVATLMTEARDKTLEAVTRMREEEPVARPSDPTGCRYCDFIDVCRIREREEPAAEGGSA